MTRSMGYCFVCSGGCTDSMVNFVEAGPVGLMDGRGGSCFAGLGFLVGNLPAERLLVVVSILCRTSALEFLRLTLSSKFS